MIAATEIPPTILHKSVNLFYPISTRRMKTVKIMRLQQAKAKEQGN